MREGVMSPSTGGLWLCLSLQEDSSVCRACLRPVLCQGLGTQPHFQAESWTARPQPLTGRRSSSALRETGQWPALCTPSACVLRAGAPRGQRDQVLPSSLGSLFTHSFTGTLTVLPSGAALSNTHPSHTYLRRKPTRAWWALPSQLPAGLPRGPEETEQDPAGAGPCGKPGSTGAEVCPQLAVTAFFRGPW